jgi:leader peptidase (prepilin peptidase)/N-methyltransferase
MLLTGVLFVGMAARFGAAPELPAFWLFSATLVALSIIDLEQRVVPNAVLYPSALAGVALLGAAALASGSTRAALDALVGAAVGFGALLAIHLAKPAGMGFGDVRFGGLIGLNVGFLGIRAVVVALFVAFLLVALAGGALVAVGRAGRRAHVPFVPFLAAGALLTVGWSAVLVRLLMG